NLSPRILLKPCRALLDWTAEGGCPHVVCGYGGLVIEEKIEIRTSDGISDGFLYRPDDKGRHPGVIHLTDIAGIRPSQEDMARRLAGEGYAVLVPNVFYRTGKPPVFDFPRKFGDEQTMKRVAELSAPLTPDAMARDASAYVDFLAAHDFVSKGGM